MEIPMGFVFYGANQDVAEDGYLQLSNDVKIEPHVTSGYDVFNDNNNQHCPKGSKIGRRYVGDRDIPRRRLEMEDDYPPLEEQYYTMEDGNIVYMGDQDGGDFKNMEDMGVFPEDSEMEESYELFDCGSPDDQQDTAESLAHEQNRNGVEVTGIKTEFKMARGGHFGNESKYRE